MKARVESKASTAALIRTMAEIRVRERLVRPPGDGQSVTLNDVSKLNEYGLEIELARALQANALAIPYRGNLLWRLVQRELALVLSLFHHAPPGKPLTRHPAFESS